MCLDGNLKCVRTIADVFTHMYGPQRTLTSMGVEMDSLNTSMVDEALAMAAAADKIVLCLGIGMDQERETVDREDIALPGLQEWFALRVLALGKPTILILINGGMIAIDSLVAPTPAIIEAFYPGLRAGEALYRAIFGYDNRWGKLPVTIYSSSFTNEHDMYSFDMSTPPGRTYRYYSGSPLFTFGYGLSYTTFTYNCTSDSSMFSAATSISCLLHNTGARAGDEVLQVFHRVSDIIRKQCTHPVPLRSLVDFTRVTVALSSAATVSFSIPLSMLTLTNNAGDKVLYAGEHYLDVTNGNSPPSTIVVEVKSTIVFDTAV